MKNEFNEKEVTESEDLLWKQYNTFVDLFKFYLDITVKSNIWFYTITGAILTYYFTNIKQENQNLKFSLLLPAVLGFGFGIIFLYGSWQAWDMKCKLKFVKDKLKLPGAPHVDVLFMFLLFSSLILFLVSSSILYLFFHPYIILPAAKSL